MFLGMTFIILGGLLDLRTGRDIGMLPLTVLLFGCVVLVAIALVLGVIALARIGLSGGRLAGRGFAVTGIVIPLALGGLGVLIGLTGRTHPATYHRIHCGANLSGMGKAMLIYANDYGDRFPIAGGDGTVWGLGLGDWMADKSAEAFGLDSNGAGGQATISSSLYLLVRSGELSPDLFVCRGDRRIRAFQPRKYGVSSDGLTDLWDFGPNPARHCSYAYHMPYGRYALTTSSEPGRAVAADRNLWIDAPRQKAADFSLFQPDIASFSGTAEDARQGNTRAHRRDGQNVLFLDSHVEFAKRAYASLRDDNVYTTWDGTDAIRGTPPKPYGSQPANEFDSLLVNDPPLGR
jgi:hypothetical protein